MNRKRLRLISVSLLAAVVALGVVLGLGTRYQTSYGSATSERALAKPVQQMRAAQRELAMGLADVLEAKQPQLVSDAQSSMAESVFSQYAPGECRLGQARYTDVLNLSGTNAEAAASYENLQDILRDAATKSGLTGWSVAGNQVVFKAAHFRVQVNPVGTGSDTIYQFQIPVLQNPQDTTSASCYPTAQLPLSAIRSLR
jgi:hypothetical protein